MRKSLMVVVLTLSCMDLARADAILISDGRRLSGTGMPNTLPAVPFDMFDTAIASAVGISSQTSSITAMAFTGSLKAAADGLHTTVYDSIFGVSFMLQEAHAYALHATMTSHSMMSDAFYSFALGNGVLNQGGFNPGILTLDRSGILNPGQYSFSLFTEAMHPDHPLRSMSDITASFSFTLTPVATPEPSSLALLGIGLIMLLGHRYRARLRVRQIARFIASDHGEGVRARR
jgi:hypothetical protein